MPDSTSVSSRPTPEMLAMYAEHFNAANALRAFGVRVDFPDTKTVRCTVDPVRPEHRGGLGTEAVNGGVLAAVFDLVLGCSAALVDPTRRSATVQLSMTFMRPVEGQRFRSEATVDHAGKRTVYSSARLYDQNDRLCAQALGVINLSEHSWGRPSPSID